jgi:transcriptional regulator with PAS, ATPase and Fis domain
MKNIQIILNAVLSKNVFEYILINRVFQIESYSSGVMKYFGPLPMMGSHVIEYLPELIGSEEEIDSIFEDKNSSYTLESVYKNAYYLNIAIEHYDNQTLLILLHNITDITVSKQKVSQYTNETTLVNAMLEKILDKQNTLIFLINNEEIVYANKQFMDYFHLKELKEVKEKTLKIYDYLDSSIPSYDILFERLGNKEEYINIENDTFVLNASLIEKTQKLFTLTKPKKTST